MVESNDPLTINEVAHRIDLERSIAYHLIQRLLGRGLLEKEQINYDHGGYYHVYSPTDPSRLRPTCDANSMTGTRRWTNSRANRMTVAAADTIQNGQISPMTPSCR